jgi:hypothetical protein
MGWRFRKRIKIAPGIHLNLGKAGFTSLSAGKRGASVNVGKRGVTGTVGIPSTGLSYTKKFSGYKNTRTSLSKPNSSPRNSNNPIKKLIFALVFYFLFIVFLFKTI